MIHLYRYDPPDPPVPQYPIAPKEARPSNETFKQYMAQRHPKTWPNSYFWKQVQNDWNNALEMAAKLSELTPQAIRKLKSPVTKNMPKSKPKTFEHPIIDPKFVFSKIE